MSDPRVPWTCPKCQAENDPDFTHCRLCGEKHPEGAEVEVAFRLAEALQASFLAVDLIRDERKNPIVVEYCPGFILSLIEGCRGYVTREGRAVAGTFRAADLMAQDIGAAVEREEGRG